MSEYKSRSFPENQNFSGKSDRIDEDAGKIDLIKSAEILLDGLKRYGWIIVILAILSGVKSGITRTTTYLPPVTVKATLTVNDNSGSMGTNTAYEMASLFPYIQSYGILDEALKEDLGVEQINGTIDVEYIDDTNFVIIRVTSQNGQDAWDILQSLIRVYPEASLYILGPVNLEVVEEPQLPQTPEEETITTRGSWKRGALKGAIAGFAIVAVLSFLRRTIRSKEEISRHFSISYLGSIPLIRQKRHRSAQKQGILILQESTSYYFRESLRKIRTRVMRSMEEHEDQVLLVTSSIPGEGKTTIATNLAISMAQKGKSVLLIDCDLRHPSVEKTWRSAFEPVSGRKSKVKRVQKDPVPQLQESTPGLEEVLTGKCALEDAVFCPEESLANLGIICGGKGVSDASELLVSPEMKNLISQMREVADVIILDTAPSAMLADASAAANIADCALYVIKCNYARIRHITEGIENLADSQTRIVGCVLNGVSRTSDASYGGYGYGYGRYGYGRYGYGEETGRDEG